jgi:hypothetical protein
MKMFKLFFLFLCACAAAQDPSYPDASVDSTTGTSGGGGSSVSIQETSSYGGGRKRRDASSVGPSKCSCFYMPKEDPPFVCLVEICVGTCEFVGPTGNEICIYRNTDPIPF